MASTSDQQVPRLFMFMHKVCLPVVRTYFNNVILSDHKYNNNFKTFLEYHKHEIYHLCFSKPCCKCQAGKVLSCKNHRLFKKQFDKVYTLGSPDRSHMSYRNGTISIHCSCGLVPNEKCSTKELDMTALYAILKTCVPNLDTSHAMWLDKIVEERHNLCHMSDMMTENETLVMWSYLEGSILGLASDIPPKPLYGETIETQVELLKDGNYSFDTVRPVIDAIRLEIAEQNNYVKETVQQTTASLQETINVQVEKVSSEMKEVVEKQSIKFVESMEKTKCDIVSAVDELKGQFTHENKSCIYDVKWLAEETTFDRNKGEIYVNFNIPSAGFTEAQTKDIKDSMRKAAESISLWKPYRIILVYKGSIVIGTLLPVDVFEEKATFEDSIRGFLDRFTMRIAGWNNQSKMQLKVNVVVCQSAVPSSDHTQEFKRSFTTNESVQAVQLMSDKMVDANQDVHETASSSFHIREYEKSFTKNESVQAVPLMSDKMVDTNEDIIGTDELRYHMISRNQSSFPCGYPYTKQFVVICWRNIDNFVVEKIKLFMENDESVRSCFTIETPDVGEIIETYHKQFKKMIYVSEDGYYDTSVLSTHLDKDKKVQIVIDVSRFTRYVTYKSSVVEQILEELTNALGPFCYRASFCPGSFSFYDSDAFKEWTVYFSSSLSTNSKVISIIDMLSNFLQSKHKKPYAELLETRYISGDVPYILPLSHAKRDITRNVKPEYIISMQLDSTTLPTKMSNVDSVDARNLQDGKWLQQLEQILGTQHWISSFRYRPGYDIECCGEYSDFALVRKKTDGLSSLSSKGLFMGFGQRYRIVFLFKKTEQETSTALRRYINASNKVTIIVLFDHAEIPDQLRAYHIILASEGDSNTYKEILKAIGAGSTKKTKKPAGRRQSLFSYDDPNHNRREEYLSEESIMKKNIVRKTTPAVNKTDLEEDTSEVQ